MSISVVQLALPLKSQPFLLAYVTPTTQNVIGMKR